MPLQHVLWLGLAVWAVLVYSLLLATVRHGMWVESVVPVLLASPALIVMLAVSVERRELTALVSLSKGSWSFLIGDTFVLTTAVACCALAWRHGYRLMPRWAKSLWWDLTAACCGLMAGIVFHYIDGMGYKAQGAAALLDSPTKLAHDFVAWPVLFGGLVCIGVPLLFNRSKYTWMALGWAGVWIVLLVWDNLRGLNPYDLHPAWDVIGFQVR